MADNRNGTSGGYLVGIRALRENYDVIELSKEIKKQGDILSLSQRLGVNRRTLSTAFHEGRVLSLFSELDKSKASILSALRTNRELKIFAEKYDLNNTSARDLIKLIKKWREDIQQNPLLLITPEEHEIIIGTLLGDGSIRKRETNSCLRFSHSLAQKDYCEFKKEIFKNFQISEFVERKRLSKNMITIDFATKTHFVFNYYRNLFYKNNKKIITNEVLDQITPRALAFWLCDDGSYCQRDKYIILCTNSFSLEEHRLMKEFFNQKFNLNPTIGFRDNKYYYLRFIKKDTEKLVNLVKKFIPDSMKYKIGERDGK
ncbi:hypothetical protein J4405_00820 [Candidatus Woesearchaeota archaeon]|nr:hypothetical protein [Candidatus Woesearchaeota archaeon]